MSAQKYEITLPTDEQLTAMSHGERARIAARFLSAQEIGRQPLELFSELARLMTLSTFEVTPLRSLRDGSKTEVLLAHRPPTDKWWPNEFNLPGSVQLPTGVPGHRSYRDAAQELLDAEFHKTVALQDEVTVFDARLRTGPRGSEQTVFGWADVDVSSADAEVLGGQFFPVEHVLASPRSLTPEGYGVVEGHEFTLERALASYVIAH